MCQICQHFSQYKHGFNVNHQCDCSVTWYRGRCCWQRYVSWVWGVGSTRPRGQGDVIQSDVIPHPSFLQSFKHHLITTEDTLSIQSASACGPDVCITDRGLCCQVERHLAIVPSVPIVALFLEYQTSGILQQQDMETVDVLPKHVIPGDNNHNQEHKDHRRASDYDALIGQTGVYQKLRHMGAAAMVSGRLCILKLFCH